MATLALALSASAHTADKTCEPHPAEERQPMSASLRAFVTNALERNRVSFGDLRRLQRTVLPHGLLTRE